MLKALLDALRKPKHSPRAKRAVLELGIRWSLGPDVKQIDVSVAVSRLANLAEKSNDTERWLYYAGVRSGKSVDQLLKLAEKGELPNDPIA